MEKTVKEDLRIRRTRKAIRNTLKEMIYEMDLEQITIKELTARAQINRKTFYLHYRDLEELLAELAAEIAKPFINNNLTYTNMKDNKALVRLVFESAEEKPQLYERILCCDSYRSVDKAAKKLVMDHRMKTNRGAFGLDVYSENLIFAYCGSNATILYRQWVADGKRIPVENVIEMATALICQGLAGIVTQE